MAEAEGDSALAGAQLEALNTPAITEKMTEIWNVLELVKTADGNIEKQVPSSTLNTRTRTTRRAPCLTANLPLSLLASSSSITLTLSHSSIL